MNSPYMKTYTQKEVSKLLGVPVGTMKRWEKDLEELLTVPRTKQGARYYTEFEITFLQKVKDLRQSSSMEKIKLSLLENSNEELKPLNDLVQPDAQTGDDPSFEAVLSKELEEGIDSKPIIVHWQKSDLDAAKNRAQLLKETKSEDEKINNINIKKQLETKQLSINMQTKEDAEEYETSIITRLSASEVQTKTEPPRLEEFFEIMDAYKQSLINEVKLEIRNGIRKEVVEEVKKEISKGSVQTVKALSNSIYKLGENTRSEIQELSSIISETTENTTENIITLSHIITATSEHTADTIESLSNHLYANSENTSETISDLTNKIEVTSEHTSETIALLSNQIAATTEYTAETIASLSNDLVSSSENTSESIALLSDKMRSNIEDTKDSILSLAERFAISSKNTNDTFRSLTKSIHQASDETNHELRNLVDALNKDRELYMETLHQERLHFKQEIRTREAMFQDLVASFRNTAVAKEKDDKKWWKFWS